jgi:mRNA interferase MazF
VKVDRGTLVVVDLDPTRGHEQRGRRPAIVVSDPEVSSDQRFPMICVVPVTSTPGTGALYPALIPGSSGLLRKSYALIDQLRAVSKARVVRVHGRVLPGELDAIDKGLYLFLGLESPEIRPTY